MSEFVYGLPEEETADAIFEKVAMHLIRQGKPCMGQDVNNPSSKPMCLYRGPNHAACAVGCLISDDDYDTAMETLTVTSMLAHYRLPGLPKHVALLDALQEVHDSPEICVDRIPGNDFVPQRLWRDLEQVGSQHGISEEVMTRCLAPLLSTSTATS